MLAEARRSEISKSRSVVYLVFVLTLGGMFIGYSFGKLGSAFEEGISFSNPSIIEFIGVFVAPMTLFLVGYVQLILDLPTAIVRRFGGQAKFLPSLTFFFVLVALADYQVALTSSGVGSFFAEGYVRWLGLLFGGVVLSIRKNRKSPWNLVAIGVAMALIFLLSVSL